MSEKTLDEVSDAAFAALKDVGNDPTRLSEPFRTIVIIYSAQGVIDNGGFAYLFESDFLGNPPYSVIVDAYRRIQAHEAADAIEKALQYFPSNRQEFLKTRHLILEQHADVFSSFGEGVCGNNQIWTLLGEFARYHFGERPT